MVVIAIVLVLLVVIILSVPFWLDLNRYRDQYLPILEQVLHRKVDIKDVRLTLFPKLGAQLQDVVIADDLDFSSKPFLTVSSVHVAVQWKPLLQRRIEVESVVIESPVVQVIRSSSGNLNISTIGNVPTSGGISIEKVEPKDSVSPLLGVLAVKQLSLREGTLQFEDRLSQTTKAYQIQKLALNTESVAIGETARLEVNGMVMPYQVPFDAIGQFGPLHANLDIPKLTISGHIGKVGVAIHGQLMKGRLTVDVEVPKASTDDMPVGLGLNKPVEMSQLQAHIVTSLFHEEQNTHSGKIMIDPLRLNLHVGQSTIHVAGTGTPSRFSLIGDSPSIVSQDLPVSLPIQQPFALEHIQFEAELYEDQLILHSFQAKAFGGSLIAKGVLSQLSPPFVFSTEGTFNKFSVQAFLKVIKPSSVSITGVGGLTWQLKGVVPSLASPELSGPTHLTIHDGTIIGFDLVKAVEDGLEITGVLGAHTGATQFLMLDAKTEFTKGVLVIRALTADAPNVSLRSEGKVGLDQSVNVQGTLGVPPVMAEKIIRRFPLAKVVKQEGQLVLPFVVRGTVQDPKFRLDSRSLGNQVKKKIEKRLEKVLQGDDQELQKLLDEGKDLLKQFFRK